MRQELLEKLSEITPEEQEILDGQTEVHQELYSTGRDFVIDSRLLLEKGRLIEIRPHTRFVYFPSPRHNYVELVYMVSGSMTHIIGGKTRITLQEGDLPGRAGSDGLPEMQAQPCQRQKSKKIQIRA